MAFPTQEARTLVRLALNEDVRTGDVTSLWTLPAQQIQTAVLIAKESGVIAGLPVISIVFEEIKENVKISFNAEDGANVKQAIKLQALRAKQKHCFPASGLCSIFCSNFPAWQP